MESELTTKHIDYLFNQDLPNLSEQLAFEPVRRDLKRVMSIGRMARTDAGAPARPARPATEDMLAGLHPLRVPIAFLATGTPSGAAFQFGTWASGPVSSEALETRKAMIRSVMEAVYLAPEFIDGHQIPLAIDHGGFAVGIPALKPVDAQDGSLPWDRLVRALNGATWACLVLAEPAEWELIKQMRDGVILEIRTVENVTKAPQAPSPLAKHYVELLRQRLRALTAGEAAGAWRTAVYLLGQGADYARLAGLWSTVFAPTQGTPEPIRVRADAAVLGLAKEWAMPEVDGPAAPGRYCRPYLYQTLLSSAQLAAYIQLPRLETAGFAVRTVPEFDVEPPGTTAGINLGRIIHRTRLTSVDYFVKPSNLTRHAFVAGVTGSGKTNTILQLLRQAKAGSGVPFLVIEPAKTEYRALLDDPDLAGKLRVYTLGDERVSPLRLNPFEAVAGTPVGVHLDLVRSAFGTAFGMWTPLPQVLERCLHRVYGDRGWVIATNENPRLAAGDDPADAFPRLSDLADVVGEVTESLGYEERVTADLKAALSTRIDGLRVGGKGAMLDAGRSTSMDELLAHPTVLELEGMGDDDDKAFLMALLVIRLVEHRRAQGQTGELRHLLVVEEAHRLLANVAQHGREEEANPRGKAVESFANLLSEVRAYGQGIIIADQVPTKLAPDVIKNTGLKVAHRVVAREDREAMGGAMAMDDRQVEALTSLPPGRAALFGDGDDGPLLVQVPLVKGAALGAPGDARRVVAHMDRIGRTRPPPCEVCAESLPTCAEARAVAAGRPFRRALARALQSTIEEAGALDRLWGDVVQVARSARAPRSDEAALLRGLAAHGADWFARRRGAQEGWSYGDTGAFALHAADVLLEKVEAGADDAGTDARTLRRDTFRELALRVHARTFDPFPACADICRQRPPTCLYRHAAVDLVAERIYAGMWQDAEQAYINTYDRAGTWAVCDLASRRLVEKPDRQVGPEIEALLGDARRRAGLCFAQQMLAADTSLAPYTFRRVVEEIVAAAERAQAGPAGALGA